MDMLASNDINWINTSFKVINRLKCALYFSIERLRLFGELENFPLVEHWNCACVFLIRPLDTCYSKRPPRHKDLLFRLEC